MPGIRPAIVVAVAGSALAGVIHLAATREHFGEFTLFWMFIACGIAQIGWAYVAVKRPTKRVLLAGIILNGGAFYFWFFSRTTGIPFVHTLQQPESIETQDLACALYAAASAIAAAVVLKRPVAKTVLPVRWSALVGAAALVLALPAIAAGHTHPAGHVHVVAGGPAASHSHPPAHGSGASSSSTDARVDVHVQAPSASSSSSASVDAAHVQDPSTHASSGHSSDVAGAPGESSSAHDHGGSAGGDPSTPAPANAVPAPDHPATDLNSSSDPPPGTPSGPIISVDDPRLTPAQQASARALIASTTQAMQAFPDLAAVQAAGYVSIGDTDVNGYEHYVQWSYLSDPYEVDPNHIESILVRHLPDGTVKVVSAMYILSIGKTMADVPDIAGALTTWHYHDDLCWSTAMTVVGTTVNGVCSSGTLWITPPMLHVWIVDNPCGPFAGVDSHGGSCLVGQP